MKNILLVVGLCCICQLSVNQSLKAQYGNGVMDSLLHELTLAKEDQSKVEILIKLSQSFRLNNLDSARLFIKQGIQLAEKLDYKKGQAIFWSISSKIHINARQFSNAILENEKVRSLAYEIEDTSQLFNVHQLFVDIYLHLGDLELAQSHLDTFIHLANNVNDKRFVVLGDILQGYLLDTQNDYVNALPFYQKAIDLAKENKYLNYLGGAYLGAAQNLGRLGEYKKAESLILDGVEVMREIDNKMVMASFYEHLAGMKEQQGRLLETIEYQKATYELFKEIGLKNLEANSLYKIGNLYKSLKKYNLAQQHILEATKINLEEGTEGIDLGKCFIQMGLINIVLKDFEQANDYIDKAETIFKEHNKAFNQASVLDARAKLYFEKKQYDKALLLFKEALEINERVESKNNIGELSLSVGKTYFLLNNLEQAIWYLKKALNIGEEIEDIRLIAETNKQLYDAYAAKKDYKKAFNYQTEHFKYRDSLTAIENSEQVNLMLAEFESEKRETEVALLNKEKEIQQAQYEAQIEREMMIRWGLVGLFICLLTLGWIIIKSYRQKIKLNAELLQKQEELSRQKILELRQKQQAKLLETMTRVEEKERFRIAKELHDGIGGALAGVKLNLKMVSKFSMDTSTSYRSIVDEIDAVYREVRTISHDLSPPALSKTPFSQLLQDYVARVKHGSSLNVGLTSFPNSELNEMNPQIQINLYRIIQECLNNILKHANAKNVQIDLTLFENHVNLFVEDDGVGFDTSLTNKGIGLTNIQSRLTSLQGKLEVDSQLGRGTSVSIEVPVKSQIGEKRNILGSV